jgi:tRNA 2-selenouridine synthase
LKESGQDISLIVGGYKKARNFLIEETNNFSDVNSMIILSGQTGSGKTTFLNEVKSFYPILDLEELAKHRGSAFGATDFEQPTQINFENQLAVTLLSFKNLQKKLLVEDESKLIGSRALPKSFFDKMRVSPVLWIDETLENRVNNIFQTYIVDAMYEKESNKILNVFSKYKASVLKISNKLGGLRTQELLSILNNSESDFLQTGSLDSNKLWIEKLLVYYYDPLYLSSIQRREVKYVFKGSRLECESFLKEQENFN